MLRFVIALATVVTISLTSSAIAQDKNPIAVIKTNKGTIKLELFADKAPNTVANFVKYAEDKHYNGTIFHRVIADFMIQGGGFDQEMAQKKTREPIKNESANGVSNKRGTIAMARTPNPHSASAQFFINVKDNTFLDKANAQDGWGYCVFGKVIDGMKVVDTIRSVETGFRGGMRDVPETPVVIESVTIQKQ